MKVSFLIIAYNAESTLRGVINNLINQDYPHELIEVILVDGNSTDRTKEIMKEFSKQDNGFIRIEVKDNPKRTLPSGWNVALDSVQGDIVLKVDAHASIPSDFISKNVRGIESGEKICGGQRPNIIDEETPWKRTLLIAESSMFGSSIAPYRRSTGIKYVKSLFHAAYSKEVFDTVGKFNEDLVRTEDNEIHYRMRKAGYKFCFDPEIISYQHTRNTLKKMLKQKYLNGYWIGKTSKICPQCLSIFHFVPITFVFSIIASCVLAAVGYKLFLLIIVIAYLIAAIAMTLAAINNEGYFKYSLLLPFIFLLLHVSYGVGTLVGLIKIPVRYKNII